MAAVFSCQSENIVLVDKDEEKKVPSHTENVFVPRDEVKNVQRSEEGSKLALQDVIANFVKEGIPAFWADRYKMQNAYSLKAKGWKVQVRWGESPIAGAGVGVFAAEDAEKGQLLRLAKNGKNLIRFRERSDLPEKMSPVTKDYITNYCAQIDDRFIMIFLPGCCYNHSDDPNIEMVVADEETIHLVAVKNIAAGTELLGDYQSFGEPPKYLKELARNESMDLIFPGYNSFL